MACKRPARADQIQPPSGEAYRRAACQYWDRQGRYYYAPTSIEECPPLPGMKQSQLVIFWEAEFFVVVSWDGTGQNLQVTPWQEVPVEIRASFFQPQREALLSSELPAKLLRLEQDSTQEKILDINTETDVPTQTVIEIRIATKEDRAKVEAWNTFVLSREPIYVGYLAGEVVAYLQYWASFTSPHAFHLQYIEVHPNHRRKHYGRALVEYMQARSDVTKLSAESVQWDTVGFWEALGFVPDGEEEWIKGEDEHAGNFEWWKAQRDTKQYQALPLDNVKALNDLIGQLPTTSQVIARIVPFTDPSDVYEVVTQVRRARSHYEVLTGACQDWRTCYYLYREDD